MIEPMSDKDLEIEGHCIAAVQRRDAQILAWCEENFLMDGMDHLFMKKYILLDNFQEYLKEKI